MWTQTVVRLLALSLSGGILCGLLWDLFKIPRVVFGVPESRTENKFHTIVVFVQDFLFCILCGLVTIVVLYYGNEGIIRGIAFVGLSVGFAAYRVTFGALTEFCVRKLCGVASKAVKKVSVLCEKFVVFVKKHQEKKVKEE